VLQPPRPRAPLLQGRAASFSCTNATIAKFRDALAKHGTDRCSLDDPELLALAANRDLHFTYYYYYYDKQQQGIAAPGPGGPWLIPLPDDATQLLAQGSESSFLLSSGSGR
jgi:hypothetical protein